jgi:uncharacterized protein (TIGR02117 family)
LRYARRLLLAIITVICIYGIGAVFGALIPGPRADIAAGDNIEILLVSGPIHYDILLPISPVIHDDFAFAADHGVPIKAPDAEWMMVGWGSHAFYTATGDYSDLRSGTITTAVTGDHAVMRIDAIASMPTDFPAIRLSLSHAQYDALLKEIRHSLGPEPQAIDHPGFSSSDRFFKASGHFSALKTCNVWVSQILRRAGVKMGIWTPTPYAITLSAWWFHPA